MKIGSVFEVTLLGCPWSLQIIFVESYTCWKVEKFEGNVQKWAAFENLLMTTIVTECPWYIGKLVMKSMEMSFQGVVGGEIGCIYPIGGLRFVFRLLAKLACWNNFFNIGTHGMPIDIALIRFKSFCNSCMTSSWHFMEFL